MIHQFTSARPSGALIAATPESQPPAQGVAASIQAAGPSPGGNRQTDRRHGALRNTRAELLPPMPAQSIIRFADAPLPRSEFAQAVFDVFSVVFCALFVTSVALAIPLSIFMLLCCSF